MNPHSSGQASRLKTAQAGSVCRVVRTFAGVVTPGICLLSILLLSAPAAGAQGRPTPPPRPRVAPVISAERGNDLDRNGIDDRLQGESEDLAKTSTSRGVAAQSAGSIVSVELIFAEPVTQSQIDAFLGLGGQIDYMYQAVSYGWIGHISLGNISALPAAMGPTFLLVEPTLRARVCTDRATTTGRVRPIWKPGFAGSVDGLSGDSNTTIGFVDSGVDASHSDLAGRCVYWNDVSSALSPKPTDTYGHGTMVVGVACGTGQAGRRHGVFQVHLHRSGAFLGFHNLVHLIASRAYHSEIECYLERS